MIVVQLLLVYAAARFSTVGYLSFGPIKRYMTFFVTTSVREKAWRSARGREGDVKAEPCMQGKGRELA